MPSVGSIGSQFKPFWHETGFRIRDPALSIPFYINHFEMQLIQQQCVGEDTHYVLVSRRSGDNFPTNVDCKKIPAVLHERTALILTHRKGYSDLKMNNGNEEPHRGFGHIAFNCNDVYESCAQLESNGVVFRKRPDEGRMKGLAFALDPDGYWIEICGRGKHPFTEKFNLSQTMIRVKDPAKAIAFYRDVLGMVVVREMHMSDFSNYFLACLPEEPALADATAEEEREFVHSLWNPCLELTHNHGTENDPDFHYHNGNAPPPVGFSHLGFHVNDLDKFCTDAKHLVSEAAQDLTENKGEDVITAVFLQDPDGYRIKLVERSHIDAA